MLNNYNSHNQGVNRNLINNNYNNYPAAVQQEYSNGNYNVFKNDYNNSFEENNQNLSSNKFDVKQNNVLIKTPNSNSGNGIVVNVKSNIQNQSKKICLFFFR